MKLEDSQKIPSFLNKMKKQNNKKPKMYSAYKMLTRKTFCKVLGTVCGIW